MRAQGGDCFCANVCRGLDGSGVGNFLDYLRDSLTRHTYRFLQSLQFRIIDVSHCSWPLSWPSQSPATQRLVLGCGCEAASRHGEETSPDEDA
jgi:hypothetical protein